MKISKNITLEEATHSNTAKRRRLDNTPNEEELKRMKIIAEEVFEPLRKHFGDKPIRINSFFRSVQVNMAVGGSYNSQHCKGEAMDLKALRGTTNAQLYYYIRDYLDFDQLIWEYGTDEEPAWVHVSFTTRRPNRKQTVRIR